MKKIIVGVTGASGALIGERLIRSLLEGGNEVHAVMSASGAKVFDEELGVRLGTATAEIQKNFLKHYRAVEWPGDRFFAAATDDSAAKVSSGSSKAEAMVIAPCSMSTVGAIEL